MWCGLFRDLNVVPLEQALGVRVRGGMPAGHGATDGKRLRGSAIAKSPGVHLLAPEWEGVSQVCCITRERIVRGKKTCRAGFAINSLISRQAGPLALLALSREHWEIENRLHQVRDASSREDQGRTHVGNAPQALAACRNTALTLLRRMGLRIIEGFEHFAECRIQAIAAVMQLRTE